MALNPFDTPSGKLRNRADVTRRKFLGIVGAIGGTGALLLASVETLKFMFPNATNEEPTAFKASSFDPATVTAPHVEPITSKRVTLVLDDGGWYAVFLVCTHLGCTPNYVTDVTTGSGNADTSAANRTKALARGQRQPSAQTPNGWACPCHGSRYFIDSTNFYGPAPRPMDWVAVSWSPDKRLIVDRGAIVVKRNAGETTVPTWRLSATPGGAVSGSTLGVS